MLNIRRGAFVALVAGVFSLVLALGAGPTQPAHAAVTAFDVGMSGAFENPPVNSPGFGMAHFTFDDSTRVLTYAVTISGLSPDQVVASHIHRGPVGTNGPIVYTLSATGFTQVSGKITLTDADVADLKAGNFYVNAHSTAFPGGFARGQLHLNEADSLADTARAAIAAYNSQDVARLAQFFTDAGFKSFFDTTKAAAIANPSQIFQGPISFRSLVDYTIEGENASATVELGSGPPVGVQTIQRERDTFVLDAGLWKLNSTEPAPVEIPAGAKVANVSLVDYSFNYDKSAAATAAAFHFTNNGTQDHEAVLFRLNTTTPLATLANTLLQGGPDAPPPPGVDFVAANETSVGGSFNFVFTQPLSAGRYAFICFFPDKTTGQPHVALGMLSEFTVGGAGTGILPPSTGDAGLAALRHHDRGWIWPAAVVLTLVLFVGTLAYSARRR